MANMKLATKLLIYFLVVGILPFAVIGGISLYNSNKALSKQAFNQLIAMREVKKSQIERFFSERQGDMGVLMETAGVLRREAASKLIAVQKIKKNQIENYFKNAILQMGVLARSADTQQLYKRLVKYHKDTNVQPTGSYGVDTPEYISIHNSLGANINKFYDDSGYFDVFVICSKHGHVMYSAAKEKDLGTNMGHGKYRDSGLARLWAEVVKTGREAVVDFSPYEPSDNVPAAFAGFPINDDNGKIIGVMAFQFSLDHINHVMQERAGMGKTGEAYLVGPDKLMRSDSYLDPVNHTVAASFANTVKGSVDTEASREALNGKSDIKVIDDYLGNPVLSAYAPLKIQGLNWVIIAEIDVAEAFSPVDEKGNEFYAKYVELYGYYDLFLINPNGYVFYSASKEADYQTNMVNGKYSSSGLGKLVRKVKESKGFEIADFESYAPSGGEPAAFIAQPVTSNGKVELIVALQLSLKAINTIMQQRDGMGESGETYLVGSDNLMRSDSFLDATNHSVKGSFANPSKGSVETDAVVAVKAGKTEEQIIDDYNGSPVLSAYTPVGVGNFTWALIAEIDESEAFAAIMRIKMLILFVGIGGVILIVVAALMIAKSIIDPINRVIDGLHEGAEQVAAASGEVSSTSQSLAEGSSEQAASVEEISSALEETSSMTNTNADNSREADSLMKTASTVVVRADSNMKELTASMVDITKASEETFKIIKTIDEIAFQTNLLALNAAVEAARAGEAGAGFAVVADEVRNLAMRAADAAKNTSEMIEGTIKRVNAGSDLVTIASEAFTEVRDSSQKVAGLIKEIAAASGEQSQGIEQINKGMGEVDTVTQQNAANAEESASASEEMNAQAEHMMAFVNELIELIGGSSDNVSSGAARSKVVESSMPLRSANVKKIPSGQKSISQTRALSEYKETSPGNDIPMDDDDFSDF